jgi:predicted MPP superfamily phosphohydrolase
MPVITGNIARENNMRIGILNDTHLGITSKKVVQQCIHALAVIKPDIIIHAGDFSGGMMGYGALGVTCRMLRREFPEIPILAVLGNHDLWAGKNPTVSSFTRNKNLCVKAFSDNNIHFLDEKGVYRIGGVTFMGHTGWYNTVPDSNDWLYIPRYMEGDTHSLLQKQAHSALEAQLASLIKEDENIVFVSHFPVRDCNPWDGNPNMGTLLSEQYGVKYFISGHSHGLLKGPVHFRTATDYYKPQSFLMVKDGQ